MPFFYYKFYKPYGVLSQFTKEIESHRTLADYLDVSKDVYSIGRLDKDSEGLLLLSNDKSFVDKYLNPNNKLAKTYFVQVEGSPSETDLKTLASGVKIKIKTNKFHQTLPCKVSLINRPKLPLRNPPIRVRKSIPTTWLSITIIEGKNRQVRKMFAKIGFPVLRLVRYSIGRFNINNLHVGEMEQISSLNQNL
jgi:23S rRNA pseudouridine2457 synthase